MVVLAALIVQLLHSPALAGVAAPPLAAFALACAAAACAGLLQILLGALRFGRLAQYLPLPVVAGFINASALLIIVSQVWPATGIQRQSSILDLGSHLAEIRTAMLVLALGTALLVRLMPRLVKRGPVMLWSLLAANLAYHLGAAMGFGEALGGTLPPPPADFSIGFIGRDSAALLLGPHGGELIRLMLPPVVSMAILATLDSLLAVSAIDELTMRHSQAGRQLVAEGLGSLLAALFSMAPGSSTMMRTQVALSNGMVSAAAPIGIALLTLVITAFLGASLTLMSQSVMAGLLIALGFELFDRWTLARVRSLFSHQDIPRVAASDLLVVIVVVAAALATDLATAVGVGVVVALISFVLQMAHSPVRRCYRATALLPRINGDLVRREFIERHGRKIAIVEIEGALFFGTSAELKQRVDALIDEGVIHIALDLKRVKDIDATGARALERINQQLKQRGGLFTLGYVDRERRISRLGLFGRQTQSPRFEPRRIWLKLAHLGSIRALGDGQLFPDIDAAVAMCEAHLAARLPGSEAALHGSRPQSPILRGIDRRMLAQLRPYLTKLTFAPGTLIFTQGGPPDAAFLLEAGRVDVVLDLPGTERKLKLQSLSAGSVFGEMALIDPQPRSASVIAQDTVHCYCLSVDALLRLKREHSHIAFSLLANIAVIFSERLRATNNMLAELDV